MSAIVVKEQQVDKRLEYTQTDRVHVIKDVAVNDLKVSNVMEEAWVLDPILRNASRFRTIGTS